ncbi:MAG: LysR family transcriptional regulator [Burkholderiales bacterium]|nr:LysR family transcriptional regulator [Burkholderiales bacterium]MDE2627837.1 LysR family transcriptional regulator [Burkholderiales bacterium]
MDIKRLTHIVALADKRNFARAAEQAHLSQPALTRSIQAAEAELGLRLFDRGPLEITPTPAGEFLLERARRMVFDSRCLKRDMDLYRDRQLGDTAFGVGPYPAATFLGALLVELRRSFAGVHVRVEVGNWESLAKRLRDEDIEFFVADTRDLPPDAGLLVQPLMREAGGFYVRAGHPLAAGVAVSLRELWSHGIASVRLPAAVSGALAPLLGLPPSAPVPLAVECDDIETLKRVVLATDTVLAAPAASVADQVGCGTLLPVMVPELPPLFSAMGIVTLRGRTASPLAEWIVRRLPGSTGSEPKGAAGR